MSARHTLLWLGVAASLFAFIFFYQRHKHAPPPGPARILPSLKATAVTSVQIRPSGPSQLEIRAERTKETWQLTQPFAYPAQAASIDLLLGVLERLTPATYITAGELVRRPKADEEYGFTSQHAASIILQQGDYRAHVLLGAKTAPGDQVFLQVVGVQGVYVVDADLLKLIPRSVNDWRDTTLLNFKSLAFDRLAVTNNGKAFALQRDATNHLWRIVHPIEARADNARIEDSLQKLQSLRIHQFVSDDPKADLESFGLQPAELDLALAQGTNTLALLQFGKSPTNNANLVYARRLGQTTIVAVPKDNLAPWRSPSINDFRDPHLLALTSPVDLVEVHGEAETFSLQRQGSNTWRVAPQNFPADPALVKDLFTVLSGMQIAEFAKDVVTPLNLPEYGLAAPARQFVLKAGLTNANGSAQITNVVIADLRFGCGTNQPGKIFARRADESSVYAVNTNDFARLPAASWQLRERKLWQFSESEVARVTIHQQGKVRQLVHNGPHQWSLAPGSQGMINDLAIEETVRGLTQATAAVWVAQGENNRTRYGFSTNSQQVTLELKNGDKATVEFGGAAPSAFPYAAITRDGQFLVCEFPWPLYRDVVNYLSIPANL
ncbi:MAG TPA: DUF4340 domain-containing protein [Candidatus Sulfotelmatobacter sp.]|nr:DUF4340 domain-containing protein [Candidatus Sulfotelmatobacter sp.]HWI57556.1 DUF4340 domain-containing protein [Bacillota bacterium]